MRTEKHPDILSSPSPLEKENLSIKIYSRLLEEYFWLLTNKKVKPPQDNLVVYYIFEIRLLQQLINNKEFLRDIHLIKKMFNGTLVSVDVKRGGAGNETRDRSKNKIHGRRGRA